LSVATVVVTLLGIKGIKVSPRWIGLLMVATSVVGEILFLWMVEFRTYFVTCARQLNAIRRRFLWRLPTSQHWVAVQPTELDQPPVFRWGSAVAAIWLLMVLLVVSLLGVGWYMFFHDAGTPGTGVAVSAICVAAAVLLSNAAQVAHQ
jgi:hypothetical protein